MFENKKAFTFPCVYGVLDDGSENLSTVRNNLSFKSAIRIVEDPSVLIAHPLVNNQITIGIVTRKTMEGWNLIKQKLNIMITEKGINVPKEFANIILPEDIIKLSSQIIEDASPVIRIAYILSVTHLALPLPHTNDYSKYIRICDHTLFHKTLWVTNIFKNKNYDDRRKILSNLTSMIKKPIESRGYDEMIVFGEEDYLKKIPSDADHVKTISVKNNGVESIGNMMKWVLDNYSKDTVVFFVRQESTEMQYSTLRSSSRMNSRSICCLNPFVLPEIPDPRPEIFQRGDPRTICGYLMKIDTDTTLKSDSLLFKCSLYSINHHEIVMGEMMMNRYMIGNGSRIIGVGYPNLRSLILDKNDLKPNMGIICPEMASLSYYESTPDVPGRPVHSIPLQSVVMDKLMGLDGDGYLETKTLLNMANKGMTRNSYNPINMYNDKPVTIPETKLHVYNADNIKFKHNVWYKNKDIVSQDYWGNGINNRDTGFTHNSEIVKDSLLIPKTGDTIESIINRACNVIILSTKIEPSANLLLEASDEEKEFFERISADIKTIDLAKKSVYGGPGSTFVVSPNIGKDVGFTVSSVREANRIHHANTNIDMEMMKMLGETTGIIVGNKWVDIINEIVTLEYPTVKWSVVKNAMDVTPEMFSNTSFVIGTQESGGWIGTMFVNHEHCKVIEIAYEHDTTSHWYLLTNGVGAKYNVLPLKHEPNKKCVQRIKDNLTKYLKE